MIELVVAIAIVAVLAAIAYPAYVDYIRRGRIAEATGELSALRVRLEQFYQDNRNYGSTATTCGTPLPAGQSFAFACQWAAGGTNQSFVATATGLAGAGMGGYSFTINNINEPTTTAYPGASGLPAPCWLKRKGSSC